MKKRSIHLEYVSILKRLATQLSGLRRCFEMALRKISVMISVDQWLSIYIKK